MPPLFERGDDMEWQPIETAPKDGTDVLLSGEGCRAVGSFYSFLGEERWFLSHMLGDPVPFDASWWMPLPPPPPDHPPLTAAA